MVQGKPRPHRNPQCECGGAPPHSEALRASSIFHTRFQQAAEPKHTSSPCLSSTAAIEHHGGKALRLAHTARSWRGEIDDQEPAIRLPGASCGGKSLAERVGARHKLLGSHTPGDPEVCAHLCSLSVKVRVNRMGDDSRMNVQACVMGGCSEPDFAPIPRCSSRSPQAQVMSLQESVQRLLECQILTVAKQVKV